MAEPKPSTNEGGTDQDGPVIVKKLKADILEGRKIGLNPIKQVKFKKAMLFTDVRIEFVIYLKDHLKSIRVTKKKIDDEIMKDILTLVGIIAAKGNFGTDKFFKKSSTQIEDNDEAVENNYKYFKTQFSELWGEIMKWNMTPSVYRNVVILLPERVMTHLTKPLHMSDFLLESFKLGGPVSLVSLQGIFLLMQNFNFEVPDFYSRLYSMFTAETLSSKYRARFFAYSREFLSSTHLPESLVASFVKKLSRLSIVAPACTLPMIFDFITNLLIQHPGLKTLLNPFKADGQPKIRDLVLPKYWDEDFGEFKKRQGQAIIDSMEDPDPFDETESDPMKTKAMESWLCEIKALQNHAISSVALKAKFVNKSVPKVEKDMDETLSFTYTDILQLEKLMCENLEPTPSHIKPISQWSPKKIKLSENTD